MYGACSKATSLEQIVSPTSNIDILTIDETFFHIQNNNSGNFQIYKNINGIQFFLSNSRYFSFYLRTTPFTNLFDQTFFTYITGSTELGPLSSHLFLSSKCEKAFVVVIKICSHIQYFHRVPFSITWHPSIHLMGLSSYKLGMF